MTFLLKLDDLLESSAASDDLKSTIVDFLKDTDFPEPGSMRICAPEGETELELAAVWDLPDGSIAQLTIAADECVFNCVSFPVSDEGIADFITAAQNIRPSIKLAYNMNSFLTDLPQPTFHRYQNDNDEHVFVAKWDDFFGKNTEVNVHLDGANLFTDSGFEVKFFPATTEGFQEFREESFFHICYIEK